MTEAQLSYYLKTRIPGDVRSVECYNTSGMPDLNICLNGVEVWLELKLAIKGLPHIRPLQYSWGMRRSYHKGRVFVVMLEGELLYTWRYPFKVDSIGTYCRPLSCPISVLPMSEVDKFCCLLFN